MLSGAGLVRSALLGLALLFMTLPATAQTPPLPVGSWSVDADALRALLSQGLDARLAQLPEDNREQSKEMLSQVISAMVDQLVGTQATFEADGSAVFITPEAPPLNGRWEASGDDFLLTPEATASGEEISPLVMQQGPDDTLLVIPRPGVAAPPLPLRRIEP